MCDQIRTAAFTEYLVQNKQYPNSNKTLLNGLAATILITVPVLFPTTAHALYFLTIDPPNTCASGTWTEMPFVWSNAGGSATFHNEQGFEEDWVTPANYGASADVFRFFVGSRTVSQLGFSVTNRNFGGTLGSDRLILSQAAGPVLNVQGVSAAQAWMSPTQASSLPVPVTAYWHTSSSVNGPGFTTDRIRYCRGSYSNWVTALSVGYRYTGILAGYEDTIYFSVAGPQSGKVLNLAIWPGPTTVIPNADVYVKCGAVPTPSSYTKRAITAGSYEFLTVTASDCPSTSTLYVAVNSWSNTSPPADVSAGRGTFNFLGSYTNASAMGLTLHVAIEGGTSGQQSIAKLTAIEAVKRLYGATNGQILVENIKFAMRSSGQIDNDYDDCAAACQALYGHECWVCFIEESAGFDITEMNDDVTLMKSYSWGNPANVLHEFGHLLLDLDDEYRFESVGNDYNGNGTIESDPRAFCGHSVMAHHWAGMKKLCTDHLYNHNLNGNPGTPPVPGVNPAFSSASRILGAPPDQPDWYDFRNHPMAARISPTTLP